MRHLEIMNRVPVVSVSLGSELNSYLHAKSLNNNRMTENSETHHATKVSNTTFKRPLRFVNVLSYLFASQRHHPPMHIRDHRNPVKFCATNAVNFRSYACIAMLSITIA